MSEEYPIPTPCKLDIGSGWILDGNDRDLVRMPGTCVTQAWEDRAHLIIDAVNDRAELIKALEKFMGWLETGMLVRDITKDAKPDWAMKMMHFVKDLGEIQALIAKATHRRTQNENAK